MTGTAFLIGATVVFSPWIGTAVIATVLFFVCCLKWQFPCFCIVVALNLLHNVNFVYESPVRIISERYGFGILPTAVLGVALLVRAAGASAGRFEYHALRNSVLSPPRGISTLILLFCLYAGLTFMWTLDVIHGLNTLVNLLAGVSLFFMTPCVLDDMDRIRKFVYVMFAWGVVLAGMLIVSNWTGSVSVSLPTWIDNLSFEMVMRTYGKRPGGFAPPQIAGNTIAFIFFIGCAMFTESGKRVKAVLALLGFIFCSIILATGSKAAAGSFLIGLFVLIVLSPYLRKRFYLFMPAIFLGFVFVLVFNSIVLDKDRLTTGNQVNNLSLTLRLEFWEVGFDLLREKILGTGIGGFARFVDPWPGAHSYYFAVLFDLGLAGCVILTAAFGDMFMKIFRIYRSNVFGFQSMYLYCIMAFWVTFFIHGTVDLAYYLPYTWIFMGIIQAVIRAGLVSESSLADPPLPLQTFSRRVIPAGGNLTFSTARNVL